jgi:hypothetical protein
MNAMVEQDMERYKAAFAMDTTLEDSFVEDVGRIVQGVVNPAISGVNDRLEEFRSLSIKAASLKAFASHRRAKYEYYQSLDNAKVRDALREEMLAAGEKISEAKLKEEIKSHAEVIERSRLAAEAKCTEEAASGLVFLLKEILNLTIEQSTNVRKEIDSA